MHNENVIRVAYNRFLELDFCINLERITTHGQPTFLVISVFNNNKIKRICKSIKISYFVLAAFLGNTDCCEIYTAFPIATT